MKRIVALASVLILSFSAASHAQINPERSSLSLSIGRYQFDHHQKLDVSPVISLRIAHALTSHWGLEGVLEYIPTVSNFVGDNNSTIHGILYHIDTLYHFMPDKQFVLFLAAGAGGISLDSYPRGADSNFMVNFGIGAKYFISDQIALRGDIRQILVDDQQTEHNLEIALGLVYAWGGWTQESSC